MLVQHFIVRLEKKQMLAVTVSTVTVLPNINSAAKDSESASSPLKIETEGTLLLY